MQINTIKPIKLRVIKNVIGYIAPFHNEEYQVGDENLIAVAKIFEGDNENYVVFDPRYAESFVCSIEHFEEIDGD